MPAAEFYAIDPVLNTLDAMRANCSKIVTDIIGNERRPRQENLGCLLFAKKSLNQIHVCLCRKVRSLQHYYSETSSSGDFERFPLNGERFARIV